MTASEIAERLTLRIPFHTDILSDIGTITNLTNAAGVSTITVEDVHDLEVGDPVSITDVVSPISISTLSRVLTIGTLVTAVDHDLTKAIAPIITISDASDANYNGTFTMIQVVNRKTIKFTMADAGVTSGVTGAKLIGGSRQDQSYNGLFAVASIDGLSFTVATSGAIAGTVASGQIKMRTRISAAASIDRAIAAYTAQSLAKAWMFVVLGSVTASKDRGTNTDLTSNMTRSNFYRQQLIENVTIYVIANTKDEIAGREIRDEMNTLLVAITKSIGFYKFSTNLAAEYSEPLIFVDHNTHQYDGAVYVHEFNFEASTDLSFTDTVGYDPDVAARDIDVTYDNNLGTGEENANDLIDLDEVEL